MCEAALADELGVELALLFGHQLQQLQQLPPPPALMGGLGRTVSAPSERALLQAMCPVGQAFNQHTRVADFSGHQVFNSAMDEEGPTQRYGWRYQARFHGAQNEAGSGGTFSAPHHHHQQPPATSLGSGPGDDRGLTPGSTMAQPGELHTSQMLHDLYSNGSSNGAGLQQPEPGAAFAQGGPSLHGPSRLRHAGLQSPQQLGAATPLGHPLAGGGPHLQAGAHGMLSGSLSGPQLLQHPALAPFSPSLSGSGARAQLHMLAPGQGQGQQRHARSGAGVRAHSGGAAIPVAVAQLGARQQQQPQQPVTSPQEQLHVLAHAGRLSGADTLFGGSAVPAELLMDDGEPGQGAGRGLAAGGGGGPGGSGVSSSGAGQQSASSGSSMCAAINGALAAAAACDGRPTAIGGVNGGGGLLLLEDFKLQLPGAGFQGLDGGGAALQGLGLEAAADGGDGYTGASPTARGRAGAGLPGGGRTAAHGSRSNSGSAPFVAEGVAAAAAAGAGAGGEGMSEDGLSVLAMRFRSRPGRVPKAVAKLGPIAELAKSGWRGAEDSRARNRVAQQRFRNRQRETINTLQARVDEQDVLIAELQERIRVLTTGQQPQHPGAGRAGAGQQAGRGNWMGDQ
ncbi:hypothetical protein TSOC_002490 [Tetrabaena socialis]|uniref:BZIP domain-containing protein n=1 Tax=Tetrabaena socialis TaxID=47790 RepID=A0A2J8ADX1_9CHLO|nr:hypothetical protein TSOC_002490 [Tetrabaena socialis]|eukprot:PNH10728.1 hypothetical protein TSOC_002490 [Tetrabaena socialis]